MTEAVCAPEEDPCPFCEGRGYVTDEHEVGKGEKVIWDVPCMFCVTWGIDLGEDNE